MRHSGPDMRIAFGLALPLVFLCLLTGAVAAPTAADDALAADNALAATPLEVAQRGPGGTMLARAFTFQNLLAASSYAAYEQAINDPAAWGSGTKAYMKRFGASYSATLAQSFTLTAVTRLRNTDLGYTPCSCSGFPARMRHAMASEFTEVRADGRPTFPLARLSGAGVYTVIDLLPRPRGFNIADAAADVGLLIAGGTGRNLTLEF